MQSKLELSDEIMSIKRPRIIKVVNIIDYYFELLLLLFDIYQSTVPMPFGIKIIHNDFCHAYQAPRSTLLFEEYGHSVSSLLVNVSMFGS